MRLLNTERFQRSVENGSGNPEKIVNVEQIDIMAGAEGGPMASEYLPVPETLIYFTNY